MVSEQELRSSALYPPATKPLEECTAMSETYPAAGETIDLIGFGPVAIKPACTGRGGHWYCVTHRETFANNLQTNFHTDDRRTHAMVWVCDEHGPEVVDSQGPEA